MLTRLRNTLVALVCAAVAFISPVHALQPAPGQVDPIQAVAPTPSVAEGADQVTDADLEAARGGLVWVVVIAAGARAASVVIRTCGSRVDSCARGAAHVFTSAAAARRYACSRWGRFC